MKYRLNQWYKIRSDQIGWPSRNKDGWCLYYLTDVKEGSWYGRRRYFDMDREGAIVGEEDPLSIREAMLTHIIPITKDQVEVLIKLYGKN